MYSHSYQFGNIVLKKSESYGTIGRLAVAFPVPRSTITPREPCTGIETTALPSGVSSPWPKLQLECTARTWKFCARSLSLRLQSARLIKPSVIAIWRPPSTRSDNRCIARGFSFMHCHRNAVPGAGSQTGLWRTSNNAGFRVIGYAASWLDVNKESNSHRR